MTAYCTQVRISDSIRIDLFTDTMFRIRTYQNGGVENEADYDIPFVIGHINSWKTVKYHISHNDTEMCVYTQELNIIIEKATGNWRVKTGEKILYPTDKPAYGLICNGCMIFDSAASIFERNKNSRFAHWFYNFETQQYDRYLADEIILDIFFIYGNNYKELYSQLNTLVGNVPMIPKQMLGFMQTQHLMQEGNQTKLLQLAKTLRDRKIPCDILVLDLEWGDAFDEENHLVPWGSRMDWAGNYRQPLDPEKMIQELGKMHFSLMLNFHSVPDFPYRAQVPIAVPLAYTGFPHPVEVWEQNMTRLFQMGIKGCWQDQRHADFVEGYIWTFLQKIRPEERVWFFQCNEMFDSQSWNKHHKPVPNTKLIGSHRYPCAWTGDCDYTWHELEYQIKAITNIHGPLKGISYLSADAFAKNAKLQARWHQFLCFSTIIKNHNQKPWEPLADVRLDLFDFQGSGNEEQEHEALQSLEMSMQNSEYIIRKFIQERYRLIPYIYKYVYEYYQTGIPICRPMMVAFCNDIRCNQNQWPMQYMFGDEILAAPVFYDGLYMEIYLPAKTKWIDYWDDTRYCGGENGYILDYPIKDITKMPLFVREGSILIRQELAQWIDISVLPEKLFCDIYPSEYAEFVLYEDDGISMEYREGKAAVTVFSCSKTEREIRILVSKTKGNLSVLPQKRLYCFVIHEIRRIETLLFNGKQIPFSVQKNCIQFQVSANTNRDYEILIQ